MLSNKEWVFLALRMSVSTRMSHDCCRIPIRAGEWQP